MRQEQPEQDRPEAATEEQSDTNPRPSQPKALSRLDRLKLKIKKLQGKNPDIYPMF